jgi:hypothetical protein
MHAPQKGVEKRYFTVSHPRGVAKDTKYIALSNIWRSVTAAIDANQATQAGRLVDEEHRTMVYFLAFFLPKLVSTEAPMLVSICLAASA